MAKVRKKRARRGFGDLLRFVVQQRGEPEAIAGGIALGMFITFSPTVGIQLILAVLAATLFKVNRLAATLPIWITNVFTVPPIYAFTYTVGFHFLPGRPQSNVRAVLSEALREMAHEGWYNLFAHVQVFVRHVGCLFYPMLIGGLVVGAVAAVVSYPITLWVVNRYRRRRRDRIRARAEELAQMRHSRLKEAKDHTLAALGHLLHLDKKGPPEGNRSGTPPTPPPDHNTPSSS